MSKERICGIYKIANTVNGKIYIGQSVDIYKRWEAHKQTPFNINSDNYHLPLYQDIRKDGIESFSFEIIKQCSSKEELDIEEHKAIRKFQSDNPLYGYNDSRRRTTVDKNMVAAISLLLKSRLLNISEIASIFQISRATVRSINRGEHSYCSELYYPLRTQEYDKYVVMMCVPKCIPDRDFRAEHTPQEVYEAYKQECLKYFNQGEQIPILFEEDMNLNFVDATLSTSFIETAEKWGFTAPCRLSEYLSRCNFPSTLKEMYAYYEEVTGRPHISLGNGTRTCPNLTKIIELLQNSGLFMTEIGKLCDTASCIIGEINQGTHYHNDNIEYPIRSSENYEYLHAMRYKQCFPSIEYRKIHTARETYEEYKRICQSKNANGEKIPIIFNEDINLDFIDEVLNLSFSGIAEKYGYPDVSSVQRHIQSMGFPSRISQLKIYYERQTGQPHPSSKAAQKKAKQRSSRISRPVAQYEAKTCELVAVFLTVADAARNTGSRASSISSCGNGAISSTNGYTWRFVDPQGNLISSEDYSDYARTHHQACLVCGGELPEDSNKIYCEDCQSLQDMVEGPQQLSDKEWFLHYLSYLSESGIGVLYSITPQSVNKRRKAIITDAELSAAREAVKQEKLAALRALVPRYLPEDM